MKIMKSCIAGSCPNERSRGGAILIEMTAALAILGIVMFALTRTQAQIQQLNAIQLAKMRCIAAGQAQLDSIAATGEPIAADEVARLWPEVSLEVSESAGEGEWTGLKLIKVRAVGKANGLEVKVELARYIDRKQER